MLFALVHLRVLERVCMWYDRWPAAKVVPAMSHTGSRLEAGVSKFRGGIRAVQTLNKALNSCVQILLDAPVTELLGPTLCCAGVHQCVLFQVSGGPEKPFPGLGLPEIAKRPAG